MVRSMLKSKQMPNAFWAEAVECAVYLLNRCPMRSVWNMTPQEAWSGRKPSVGHLRVFGCIAYAHVPKQRRTKLDDRSEHVLIGYDSRTKAYKLYDPHSGKVSLSRDVEFDEERTWEWKAQEEWNNPSMFFEEEAQEPKEAQTPTPPSSPIHDSDWAGDLDEWKSTRGYVFFMGNTAFSWSSKKQPIITLSTCEAEYVAASSGVCHAIWLRNMLKELQIVQEEPTKIYMDNKSAIALAKNPILHERSKHIDTRFHFIREHVKDEEIELIHVKSRYNVSDIFTKPLKHESFLLQWNQLDMIKFKGGC
ncbi:hypothetical protein HHK36_028365 [Tetracentron sinense]|uniref:Retroviral polymerase SH3-like domain-containing protein n=1 Tax=Tetracentron sinense TaxID=13715 RepID=A0A835D0I6_TETSI|nr:hypothetical protein HHK36_028365 [Tetracentron sinense]